MKHSQAEPKLLLDAEYVRVNFTPTQNAPRPQIVSNQQLRLQHGRFLRTALSYACCSMTKEETGATLFPANSPTSARSAGAVIPVHAALPPGGTNPTQERGTIGMPQAGGDTKVAVA